MELIFSVSELIEALNHHLALLGEITVQGEITALQIRQNRLIFMTLSDGVSNIDVFGLSHQLYNVKLLEIGQSVTVYATCGFYQKSGRFRLFASQVIPLGAGNLKQIYQKLFNLLTKEGLFDDSRKRSLPFIIEHIALITGPNSQALADFVKISRERSPFVKIHFVPAVMQGKSAVKSIISALDTANKITVDCVVLTRGGGSVEDLAVFNDELLTRAVFASIHPIVSAIGHEGNVSLVELASDKRASTPSDAAELVCVKKTELINQINRDIEIVKSQIINRLTLTWSQIFSKLITQNQQLSTYLSVIESDISKVNLYLNRLNYQINDHHQIIAQTLGDCRQKLITQISLFVSNLNNNYKLLYAYHPKATLKRGYTITYNQSGHIITSSLQSTPIITTEFYDGKIKSKPI